MNLIFESSTTKKGQRSSYIEDKKEQQLEPKKPKKLGSFIHSSLLSSRYLKLLFTCKEVKMFASAWPYVS
jgi:hypothetical protein